MLKRFMLFFFYFFIFFNVMTWESLKFQRLLSQVFQWWCSPTIWVSIKQGKVRKFLFTFPDQTILYHCKSLSDCAKQKTVWSIQDHAAKYAQIVHHFFFLSARTSTNHAHYITNQCIHVLFLALYYVKHARPILPW